MNNLVTLTHRVEHAAGAVRDHSASEASAAIVSWLDAACDLYKQQLVEVERDGLAGMQAQVKQLEMLRLLVTGTLQTNGCI